MSRSRDPKLWEPPLEHGAPRPSLWQRMAHRQGTCGGVKAGCPLCCASSQGDEPKGAA